MSKKAENVIDISLERLLPFQEHPFHVRDDEQMAMIVESIRSVGVLVPAMDSGGVHCFCPLSPRRSVVKYHTK